MAVAIRIDGVSKEYRLGKINHGMLYKDAQAWLARRLGRQDPHAKIGARSHEDSADRFWALKDVSLEIAQGDRVGLIGKNGAGKSTLLKILSRITAPTEGSIGIRGRVASLLEVGTGFHQELTGRENVYLNGAILGMKRREVARKFDEIVAFSEIEKFIDTPVKRYSSGMYVRLAFAVAAHLDSEILLADEVLAVGDQAFQKKCLGKMEDVSRNQGRTIVFVSHNMGAVSALCTTGMYLDQGALRMTGSMDSVIARYFAFERTTGYQSESKAALPRIKRVWFESRARERIEAIENGTPFNIAIELESNRFEDLEIRIQTMDDRMRPIWAFTNMMYKHPPLNFTGTCRLSLDIDQPRLASGSLDFDILLRGYQQNTEYTHIENISLAIIESPYEAGKTKYSHWPVFCEIGYSVEEIQP